MWRKLAIALTAAVSLGVAAMPADVMAAARGGGGGHGGFGGGGRGFSGFSGVRNFSAPGGFSRGVPGGTFINRGVGVQPFVNRGVGVQPFMNRRVGVQPFANRGISAPLAGRHVIGGGRWAWIGGHRRHGRHIHGFIPGIGYGWYWYYDDCYVLTDYGWINICGYDY